MQAMVAALHILPPLPLPPAATSKRSRRLEAPAGVPRATSLDASDNPTNGMQAATPLLDAVLERGGRGGDVPFHVPGHKRGASTPPALRTLLGGALRYDLTELEGLDVLSTPSGPILAAQQAAAAAWGANATWFLVNGTTTGIHAAVLATCGPGQALILARNAHLSAFNAMVLAGCTPVYVQPCYDPQLGVAHAVTPAALRCAFEEATARGLTVGAALVVSPTYFGVMSDVAGLAAVCHEHGAPLLVDEAHGAHLGLHPSLPPSALQSGADLAVQSTHKQLSALTQAAMLHVKGPRVARERVSRALQVLQSSSPSYLLMCSLDAARAQAADPQAHEASLAAAALARQRLAAMPGVRLLSAAQAAACGKAGSGSGSVGSSNSSGGDGGKMSSSVGDGTSGNSSRSSIDLGSSSSSSSIDCSGSGIDLSISISGGIALDPLRLTLDLQECGLSGYEAAAALERQHGIVPELATPTCVVLALSIGSTVAHAEALVAAVEQLSRQHSMGGAQPGSSPSSSSASSTSSPVTTSSSGSSSRTGRPSSVAAAVPPEVRLSPRDAFFAASEAVPAAQAVGRVSAELLCPYPPGVPAAYPGEVLTAAVLQQLREVLASGGTITGCSDGSLATLRVVVTLP